MKPVGAGDGGEAPVKVSKDRVDQLLRGVSEEEVAPGAAETESQDTDDARPAPEPEIPPEDASQGETDSESSADPEPSQGQAAQRQVDAAPDEAFEDPGPPAEDVSGDEEDTDSLLSAEELDRLLNGEDEAELPPAVSDAAEAEGLNDLDAPPIDGDRVQLAEEPEDEASLISQADIDRLLGDPGDDESLPEADMDDGEGLVTQEDIDRLLMGGAEDDIDEEMVSGDLGAGTGEDIDKLLGLEEAGEAASEKALDDETAPLDREDIDRLLQGSDDDPADLLDADPEHDGAPADKVILEEAEDPGETAEAPGEEAENEGDAPRAGAWYRSRLLWVCGSVAVFLVISSLAGLFYFRTGSDEFAEPEDTGRMEDTDVAAIPIPQPTEAAATLGMADFIVLAAADDEAVVFLKAALSIEFQDNTSLARIKKHEAYFRFLVYNELQAALNAQKSETINQPAIIDKITRTLQKTLPDQMIRKVAFSEFEIVTGRDMSVEEEPEVQAVMKKEAS
jgi:flagellar basal body-associated protein FliL